MKIGFKISKNKKILLFSFEKEKNNDGNQSK